MACRSAVQESTACTPALLMLRTELRTTVELAFGRDPNSVHSPPGPMYAQKLQEGLESAHTFAQEQLQQSGWSQKRNYDVRMRGRSFAAGEMVWVYREKRALPKARRRMDRALQSGERLERLGEMVFRVQFPGKGRKMVLHGDQLAPYFSIATSYLSVLKTLLKTLKQHF